MKAPKVLLGNQGVEGAELEGVWGGSSFPIDKGVWESVVNSPIGVRGRAPEANECLWHNSIKVTFPAFRRVHYTFK